MTSSSYFNETGLSGQALLMSQLGAGLADLSVENRSSKESSMQQSISSIVARAESAVKVEPTNISMISAESSGSSAFREVANLQAENRSLRAEIQGLRDDNQGLRDDNQNLRDDNQGLRNEIQSLRDDIQGLRTVELVTDDLKQHQQKDDVGVDQSDGAMAKKGEEEAKEAGEQKDEEYTEESQQNIDGQGNEKEIDDDDEKKPEDEVDDEVKENDDDEKSEDDADGEKKQQKGRGHIVALLSDVQPPPTVISRKRVFDFMDVTMESRDGLMEGVQSKFGYLPKRTRQGRQITMYCFGCSEHKCCRSNGTRLARMKMPIRCTQTACKSVLVARQTDQGRYHLYRSGPHTCIFAREEDNNDGAGGSQQQDSMHRGRGTGNRGRGGMPRDAKKTATPHRG